jgi:hypothetical protein
MARLANDAGRDRDPEGNETSLSLLRKYFLMLQYAGELVQRSGHERDIQRLRGLLSAA